jgi:hypothetical protein
MNRLLVTLVNVKFLKNFFKSSDVLSSNF